MIVVASVFEIMEHFGVNSLSEARDRFQALAAADLPEPNSGLGARGHCHVMMMSDDHDVDWLIHSQILDDIIVEF